MSLLVLASQPRSGTHMLHTAYVKHPRIYLEGEIFNFHNDHTKEPSYDKARSTINNLIQMSKTHNLTYTGFIHHIIHSPAVLDVLLSFTDTKFICLLRRDQLRRYVSIAQANIHQRWQVHTEDKKPQLVRLEINTDDLIKEINNYKTAWANFMLRFRDFDKIILYYEDIATDFDKYYRQTLDFLKLDYVDSKPGTIKIGADNLEDVIYNQAEITKMLDDLRLRFFSLEDA